MADFVGEIISVKLGDEMRKSYMDYAMSVIIGRALPDMRDGLKPVHRRTLYAMHELGNAWNKPHKKSARVVGDVIGKYHPHGETAVYDTLVRMAQPFSLRYMLVDGQGNFGSVDGDAPAAMRYTEVRMSKIAHELLADLDKETVDFIPNYDNSESEPLVLPTRAPNLLINGASGIAVGMATNIPPHNLTEVVAAALALLDNPAVEIDELMRHLPGPDFPTAGLISGRDGIREAYHTGRGRVVMRARARIERDGDAERIVVTELPYLINKAHLLQKIAELSKAGRVANIAELRDESDKDGLRMVVTVRRGESAAVVLNNLYRHTRLETVFGVNMVALTEGRPVLANLKIVLEAFIRHRRDVVTRRSVFELRRAREKAHILEGQAVALANIDEVVALIKAAPTPPDAKRELRARAWPPGLVAEMLTHAERVAPDALRPDDLEPGCGPSDAGYRLSDAQAQAILDMRLQRLTGLERDKILSSYRELVERITELLEILSDPDRLTAVIRDELEALRAEYSDPRRTEILDHHINLSEDDLIEEEDIVVTISRAGYAKAQTLDSYRVQHRGGRGKSSTALKEEDRIERLLVANTHDTLLCFSSLGKLYHLKAHRIPRSGRAARGRPLVNLLQLAEDERIVAMLPVRDFPHDRFVFMATAAGRVKRTSLARFARAWKKGIIALRLVGDDELIGAEAIEAGRQVMLFSAGGRAIRFPDSTVRAMGRVAAGVRGMRLPKGDRLVALAAPLPGDDMLLATRNGYGKRTPVAQFPLRGRGGLGVISIKTTERNGEVIGAIPVGEDDQALLISDKGVLIRTTAAGVSRIGRRTAGVRLANCREDERLVRIAAAPAGDDAADEEAEGAADDAGASGDANSGGDAAAGGEPDAGPDANAGDDTDGGDDADSG